MTKYLDQKNIKLKQKSLQLTQQEHWDLDRLANLKWLTSKSDETL